jgi:hypothetical protein
MRACAGPGDLAGRPAAGGGAGRGAPARPARREWSRRIAGELYVEQPDSDVRERGGAPRHRRAQARHLQAGALPQAREEVEEDDGAGLSPGSCSRAAGASGLFQRLDAAGQQRTRRRRRHVRDRERARAVVLRRPHRGRLTSPSCRHRSRWWIVVATAAPSAGPADAPAEVRASRPRRPRRLDADQGAARLLVLRATWHCAHIDPVAKSTGSAAWKVDRAEGRQA